MPRILKPGPASASPRKLPTPEPAPAPAPEPRPVIPRLPDGSKFQAVYNANPQIWVGHLKVVDEFFESQCSGVFGLMSKLDKMYRAWLKQQPADVQAMHDTTK